MRDKQDQYEDEKIQKDLRDELNPGWRQQRQEHFKILGLNGTTKRSAGEVLNGLKKQARIDERLQHPHLFE